MRFLRVALASLSFWIPLDLVGFVFDFPSMPRLQVLTIAVLLIVFAEMHIWATRK